MKIYNDALGIIVQLSTSPPIDMHQWVEDFVAEVVEPKDTQGAEKLSIALRGKGAFRHFKDVLYHVGDEWVQVWYQWKDARLNEAIKQWLADLPLTIIKE